MDGPKVTRPLLVVDGDNLTHRAYHSTPSSVMGIDGRPINAIVGFFSMLVPVWRREQPRAIYVAWDTLGVDTYRNGLWPAYQSGREFEPSIVAQLGILPTLCDAFGFGVGKAAGFEADDLVATAVTHEVQAGGSCLIYTTDKDSYQLVSDRVHMLAPKKGAKEPERIGPVEVVERFGVLPEQVPDFKALAGDSSDKIPGIRGIGPKGAAALLLKHGSLDSALESFNEADAALARMFREVATMQFEAPVNLPTQPPSWADGIEALRVLGATGLADRLEALDL